jgi:hypothetical protein
VEGSQIHIWPFFRGAFLCAPLFLSPPFLRKLHTSHRAKFQSPFTRFPAQFLAHPMSLNQLLPHLIFASVTKITCHKNLRRERSKQQPAVRLLAVKLRAFLWITSDFQTINLIVASTLPSRLWWPPINWGTQQSNMSRRQRCGGCWRGEEARAERVGGSSLYEPGVKWYCVYYRLCNIRLSRHVRTTIDNTLIIIFMLILIILM